jgi:pimeloyl-ACP methyl ester carboxylesterase
MGGLLTRAYLRRYRPDRLGGIIMMSPPATNAGYQASKRAIQIWSIPTLNKIIIRYWAAFKAAQTLTFHKHQAQKILGRLF